MPIGSGFSWVSKMFLPVHFSSKKALDLSKKQEGLKSNLLS